MVEIERTVALYEKILEAVPGGVVYVAHDGTLLLANEPAQRFLGLRLDEDTKRYVADFATDTFNEDGSPCAVEDYPVARCLSTAQPQPSKVIGVRQPHGSMRWAAFTALPFDPGDGNPTGAVVSFIDITARKEAEDQVRLLQATLAQRERLATVGTLAAAVAHEVNNPLAFMFLGLENVRKAVDRGVLEASALRAEMDDLQTGAIRIRDIVQDLLAFAKVRDNDGPSDVNEAIRTAVRLASPELRYRASVSTDLHAEGKVVAAGRLSQVVLNLLLNAGRSMAGMEDAEIVVTSQRLGDDIVIDVIDNGPGVDIEISGRVFEAFFTTHEDGTGLGLPISRALVLQLGGTLELVENAAQGACFRIVLPTAGLDPTPTLDDIFVDGGRQTLLFVDDEAPILRLCQSALEPDYQVITAASVTEALAVLRDVTCDMIVCDTMLLDGSGIDVWKWVAQTQPSLIQKFLFITGGAFTSSVSQFFEDHDLEVLLKPFRTVELKDRIRGLLKGAGDDAAD